MGFFDNSTTQSTQFGPKIRQTHKLLNKGGLNAVRGWMDNPEYQIAGLSSGQKGFGRGIRDMLGSGASGYADQIAGLAGRGNAALGHATVGLDDINGYAKPLADMLNKRGGEQIQQGYEDASGRIAGDEAAANAFSGSSSAAALRRSQLANDVVDARKDMSMGNEASAYQMGAGLAGQNADRNIGAIFGGLNADLSALSAADASRLAGLGLDQQTLAMLGGYGDLQRSVAQDKLNIPYNTAQQWLQYMPGIQGTTTQTNNPSMASNIGAIGSFLTPFVGGMM